MAVSANRLELLQIADAVAREKLDVAWAYLMAQAPLMSNPAEFREKMIDIFYGEGSLEPEQTIEFDEIRGKDGRIVRVPRPPKRECGSRTR